MFANYFLLFDENVPRIQTFGKVVQIRSRSPRIYVYFMYIQNDHFGDQNILVYVDETTRSYLIGNKMKIR